MPVQSLYHTFQRYRTLQTHRISTLPIVILMPHSACNCRCVMCDIWKDNKNLKQLTEADVKGLLASLKQFGTRQVVMSGGEALLNGNFFTLCELLKTQGISVSLLSTGLLLKKYAEPLLQYVNDIIVSLDGDEETHDQIRNIPGAYQKLAEGITAIKSVDPGYRITARTVIHKLNFRKWPQIIDAVRQLGLDQISFLPADVSSQAFNREVQWDATRQGEVAISEGELPELKAIVETIADHKRTTGDPFIAESAEKIKKIYGYYSALHGHNPFPYKQCNAPWVSTVIEADGSVRPCFFLPSIGNIRDKSLQEILNSDEAVRFRKSLDMDANETCLRCVCYLNLKPGVKVG